MAAARPLARPSRVAGLLPALLAACGTAEELVVEAAGESAWFEERAARAGIGFRHVSGADGRFLFPEIMGGGVALVDHDADGDLDLYLVQGGVLDRPAGAGDPANALLANEGALSFRDVGEASGADDRGYGMGAAVADVDGDGDDDLFVTNVGPDVLLVNRGDGSFARGDRAPGAGGNAWSTGAAFLDHDGDGDLDLFVVRYVVWSPGMERSCRSEAGRRIYCSPSSYEAPAPDALFENRGDGRFEDASERAGLFAAFGNGLGVAVGDFDRDGRPDVYVANDGNANQLWRNLGDGGFQNEAGRRGCAVNATGRAEAGMGVQALDLESDGDLDIFLTHLRHETNTFYRNDGAWFEDVTAALGLASSSYAFTGFGLGFHDLDHDGLRDLYVANGRVVHWDPALDPDDVYAEPNLLFAGRPGGGFEEVRPRGGTLPELLHASRGTAFGDLDDDGDVDAVVANRDAAPYLLENVAPKRGAWLALELRDDPGRAVLHAEVLVRAGERRLARRVERSYGYLGSSDPRVHIGLGEAEAADEVLVRWPDGAQEDFGPLAARTRHVLRRGAGRSLEEAGPR